MSGIYLKAVTPSAIKRLDFEFKENNFLNELMTKYALEVNQAIAVCVMFTCNPDVNNLDQLAALAKAGSKAN